MISGMACSLFRWIGCSALPVVMTLATGGSALAADEKVVDGRLQNYGSNVIVQGGGTATSVMVLIGLGALCMIVLFKNAKRSHLD